MLSAAVLKRDCRNSNHEIYSQHRPEIKNRKNFLKFTSMTITLSCDAVKNTDDWCTFERNSKKNRKFYA